MLIASSFSLLLSLRFAAREAAVVCLGHGADSMSERRAEEDQLLLPEHRAPSSSVIPIFPQTQGEEPPKCQIPASAAPQPHGSPSRQPRPGCPPAQLLSVSP